MPRAASGSPCSTSGLADLACALATDDDRLIRTMADLLDLAKTAESGNGADRKDRPIEAAVGKMTLSSHPAVIQLDSGSLEPVPFWRLEEYRGLEEGGEPESPVVEFAEDTWPTFSAPTCHDLASWRELQPRLRRALSAAREGRDLDIDELVRRVGQGRLLHRLPRRRYPGWGPRVRIVLDRSERLTPYWQDQDRVLAALVRLLPRHGHELAVCHDGSDEPEMIGGGDGGRYFWLPPPASLIVVLGDLGCLARDGANARRVWRALGARWRAGGCRLVALMPGPPVLGAETLRPYFTVLPWERPRGSAPQDRAARGAAVERLLRLLSPAVRIEPGLLRAVRLSLGAEAPDAGAEAEFWQNPAVASRSSVAATLDAKAAAQLRSQFDREPAQAREAALACLRAWRGRQPREIWCEEVLTLAALGQQQHLPEHEDLRRARRFYQRLSQQGRGIGTPPPGALRWYRRCERRLPDAAWKDSQAGAALQRLTWTLHKDEPDFSRADRVSPKQTGGDEPLRHFTIAQNTDRLVFRRITGEQEPAAGSPLAIITSRSGRIEVTPLEHQPGTEADFWLERRAPNWADAWGRDEFGAWVEFVIDESTAEPVRQRLRWIVPGRFQMGSPADEPGRFDDEGPQHEVIVTEGYWLFDTPCTQALWQAVMGENPSRFQSSDRPVEQLSWDDCRRFFDRINERWSGLQLTLPSEAQWEYACRAGSRGAVYAGDFELLGENNTRVLDPIAWYGGNSGNGFELEDGEDSSSWSEKQYPHEKAGTHPVGRKAPNAWGLYDMLGNVWEWCFDGQREYARDAVSDPLGTTAAGAERVVRGGSWNDNARDVRCACRVQAQPGIRDSLGFRPARVQVREPGGKRAEPAAPAFGRYAERRLTPVPSGAAAGVTLRGEDRSDRCLHPEAAAFEVTSDTARLTFHRLRRPEWARAMGRDRCGLWIDIEVENTTGEPIVQRLRWIPPGQFLMGSPADEAGRRSNEGPQHEVIITRGYWLFDTPCTQALWQAVMGENPSRFQSSDRPVEQVSWDDCRRFLERMNRRQPGLQLVLPSEAQWEHACRAGSPGAVYAGEFELLGENNAPALDPIAWYGGNSGNGFELQNGLDSSSWSEKQYPHKKAGTHPVGRKTPSVWGLYDMLGNVWEWCLDGQRDCARDAVSDPLGTTAAGAGRVVRGGSWDNNARFVRCACHNQLQPDDRDSSYLGFRPARVQS